MPCKGFNNSFCTSGKVEHWLKGGDKSLHAFMVTESVLAFFILFGNLLTVFSICVFRGLGNASNYLLINLAVSDLLVAIVAVPLNVWSYLTPRYALCNRDTCTVLFGANVFSLYSSLLSLFAIVLDRFLTIHFPLGYPIWRTKNKLAIVLTFIWSYMLVLSFLPLMGGNEWDPTQHYMCSYFFTCVKSHVLPFVLVSVGICLLLSGALYVKIFRTAAKKRKASCTSTTHAYDKHWFRREMKTSRITAVVYVLFMLFYLPHSIVLLLGRFSSLDEPILGFVRQIALAMYITQSAINPLVYSLMNEQLRRAYKVKLHSFRWLNTIQHVYPSY